MFGVVSVYWLVLVGSRSRWTAILSSAATALVSPSFLFLPRFRIDSAHWSTAAVACADALRRRAHISALSILPAALAAAFVALRRWHPLYFAVASVLSAAVVAHNFYGATAIAIFFPVLAWCVWVGERDARVWWRAVGIALLAYGLSAIWLTPSYVQITLTDLKWVSEPSNAWSAVVTAGLALVFAAVTWRIRPRSDQQQWTVFVAGVAGSFSLRHSGPRSFSGFTWRAMQRFVPELDLALILAFFELMRRLWRKMAGRMAAVVLTGLFLLPAVAYLPHAWLPFPKAGVVENTYPYQISKWAHENLAGQRLLPTGEARFWFDAWFDNIQPDGGSMQGMLNQTFPWANAEIHGGKEALPSVIWLQALGTDGIIVADAKSREHYSADFSYPAKFRGFHRSSTDDHQGHPYREVPSTSSRRSASWSDTTAEIWVPTGCDIRALYVTAVIRPLTSRDRWHRKGLR